ncbi:MAG: hypothetical protein AABY45_04100 [Deltaproteobacteria bacterium]
MFIALCLPSMALAGNISNAVSSTERFFAKAAKHAQGIEPMIHEHAGELAGLAKGKKDETIAALKTIRRGRAPGERRSRQIVIIVESGMNDYIKSAKSFSQFVGEQDKSAFAAFIAGAESLKEAEIKRLKSLMLPEAPRLKTRSKRP